MGPHALQLIGFVAGRDLADEAAEDGRQDDPGEEQEEPHLIGLTRRQCDESEPEQDGNDMLPGASIVESFFEADGNTEVTSIVRYAADVGPGQHTFTVQAAASAPDVTFTIDDWVFMVTKASQK